MDFFERLLGISPDGGDGSTETLYLITVLVAFGAWVFRHRIRDFFNRHRAG